MISIPSRGFSSQSDLQSLIAFIKGNRSPERICDYPSIADLREILADQGTPVKIQLWLHPDGTLAAYALLDLSWSGLAYEAEASPYLGFLEEAAISWGCTQASELNLADAIQTACLDTDAGRQARLLQEGFTRRTESTLHYERSLEKPLPVPCLPAGFAIRPVNGEADLEELVLLHHLACGSEQMTPSYRRAMMLSPDYLPQGDLVAVDPQRRLAAYCACWISPEENGLSGRPVGHTDPVGTRPDCRRLGLSRSLLISGFRYLKSQGMQIAALSTSSDNLPARAAFESAGFKQVSSRDRYILRK